MSLCGNCGSPIDYRTATCVCVTNMIITFNCVTSTAYAENSVSITRFGTCSSLAYRLACFMNVEASLILIEVCITCILGVTITVKFGCYYIFVRRECAFSSVGIGNKTCICIYNNLNLEHTVRKPHAVRSHSKIFILLSRVILNHTKSNIFRVKVRLCHPNTNRKLCKNVCCSFNLVKNSLDSNFSIVITINSIGCLKSVCNIHTLKFPLVNLVKIDISCNFINLSNIISNKI